MKARIDRRPTFPTGTTFLGSWTIECPIFCIEDFEIYRIQADLESLFGFVIRSRTKEEALQEKEKHMDWWNLLGKHRVKVLDNDICPKGQWYLLLACIAIPNKIVLFEEPRTTPLTQVQVESLMAELIVLCRLAQSQGVNPMIEIGAVLLVEQDGATSGICFFVTSISYTETDCIESIAKFVYLFATGISPTTLTSASSTDRASLPAATRWNKDINKEFSSLLGLCLDKRDPKRITSLSTLEAQLDRLSGGGIISRGVTSDTSQEDGKKTVDVQTLHGLARVAGMIELKALLTEEVIRPIRDPEPFKQYGLTIPNGMLLYGPPGCGKTFIARQLAEELDFYFVELIPSEIASPYIHHSVLKVRDIFATAEQHAPSIIFIDEFDALVPSRSELGGHQQYKSEEVNEFLVHLNECASKNIFVIAATNEPGKIDQAIQRTGRLDKIIYVSPPDIEARIELLKMYLSGRPMGSVNIKEFARLLEGYSCSDIRNIVDESARLALKGGKLIENKHLSDAICRNPSSLSGDILSKYKEFRGRGL